ncbi:MAG TPA: TolC family protein, partial [Xanthobacteraceae bacterium]|nr:TolC family protein [Xanthobacteraceae bacterium]
MIFAVAATSLLARCAVGPDFVVPTAPDVDRYTAEPLALHTSSTDAPTGRTQHFMPGGDIPQQWWALFKSPALNALVEQALSNNPSLQSALATLRAAKESVYAQEGKYFPQLQYNFNPTTQKNSAVVAPTLAS